MEWYEAEVQDLERERPRHAALAHPAVFYGSSSIKLWTTLADDLGDESVVNLGFGGSTLEACVWFFERLVPPIRPSSLVVYAGDNDLGDGRTPADVAALFKALITKVDHDLSPIPFGFISIKPSPARLGLLEQVSVANEAIRREILRHPRAFYIDVFTPMLGVRGAPRRDLFLDDGLHLSRAGYRLWAVLVAQYRDRIFTQD
jgi:lysophospholipase L1-like esterase